MPVLHLIVKGKTTRSYRPNFLRSFRQYLKINNFLELNCSCYAQHYNTAPIRCLVKLKQFFCNRNCICHLQTVFFLKQVLVETHGDAVSRHACLWALNHQRQRWQVAVLRIYRAADTYLRVLLQSILVLLKWPVLSVSNTLTVVRVSTDASLMFYKFPALVLWSVYSAEL